MLRERARGREIVSLVNSHSNSLFINNNIGGLDNLKPGCLSFVEVGLDFFAI